MLKKLCHLLPLVLLAACSRQHPAEVDAASSSSGETYGYALLYSVTSQQQNVDKLLWVKDPGAQIEAWIRQIAAFNKAVTQQLEAWKADGRVANLKELGLPPAEDVARARATRRTTGELLFNEDTDLRVALVVAQLKALGYCADLCYAIDQETDDADIQKVVQGWETQFGSLNSQGMGILEVGMATQKNTEEDEKANNDAETLHPPAFHKQ